MKSLEELRAIKEKMKASVNDRNENSDKIKVVIGMATCGIAAGARPVMQAFLDEIAKRGLDNVTVSQTGCIGMCKLEPLVDVFLPGEEKVTYIKMTPEKAVRVVNDHIVNKNIVSEYTIGSAE
ncbi:MAG: (2Fe-2S) ferredoxin domain-containing protein [Clostridia bacterium]|jgi:NADP-reducing hydrogenase subunit HndB|nr:(2Fe-2S) ferredoxin domain-containing protein [Clostridia bacterium]MBQ6171987.1 (2Fe-2S) ferredoxin domain-containing protein [Clostridia bacterium]